MTITRVLPWGQFTGTNTSGSTAAYVAGDPTDVILLAIGGKNATTATWTSPAWVELGSVIGGSGASGGGTGAVVSKAYHRNAEPVPTSAGSDAWTSTSVNAAVRQSARFARTSGFGWSLSYAGLGDTTITGTTVAATGPVTAGQLAAGDVVFVSVILTSATDTHTGQTLTIPGVTLGAFEWGAKSSTTTGNDGSIYVGWAPVESGTSTAGTATYTATNSVSGLSGAAVSVVRLREDTTAPPAAGAGGTTVTVTTTGDGARDSTGAGAATVAVVTTGTGAAPADAAASGAGATTVTVTTTGAGAWAAAGAGGVTATVTTTATGTRPAVGGGVTVVDVTVTGAGTRSADGAGATTVTVTTTGGDGYVDTAGAGTVTLTVTTGGTGEAVRPPPIGWYRGWRVVAAYRRGVRVVLRPGR